MTGDDLVEVAIDRYLAYLEGDGEAPDLESLPPAARREVKEVIAGLDGARGIDPYGSPPSVESLVAGTEFEGLFGRGAGGDPSIALDIIRSALEELHSGCRIEPAVDEEGHGLIARRRDLVIYLFVQRGVGPTLTGDVRRRAVGVFAKPDVAKVCVVSAEGPEYSTLVLGPADLGLRYTTPDGARTDSLAVALPLELAFRQLLEVCAPEWDPVDLSTMDLPTTPIADIALPIIQQAVEREAGRAYRGDKARAYRAMLGHEEQILAIVSDAAVGAAPFDAEAAVVAIVKAAA